MLERYKDRLNKIDVNFEKVDGLGGEGYVIEIKSYRAVILAKKLSHNTVMRVLDAMVAHHRTAYEKTKSLRQSLEHEYYQKALKSADNHISYQNKQGL